MRLGLRIIIITGPLVATGLLVAGCGRSRPARRTPAAARVTIVGCVEQGREPDDVVIVGRAVDEAVATSIGNHGRGGLPSTTTLRGGDGDRQPSAGTREDWASQLAPRLVGGDAREIHNAIDHRVVMTGLFEPAKGDVTFDQLAVVSIQPVGGGCTP